MITRFTYSVLVKRKGIGKGLDGLFDNLPFAKQEAKRLKGKVIRFKNRPDGSCLVSGPYVILRGRLN